MRKNKHWTNEEDEQLVYLEHVACNVAFLIEMGDEA